MRNWIRMLTFLICFVIIVFGSMSLGMIQRLGVDEQVESFVFYGGIGADPGWYEKVQIEGTTIEAWLTPEGLSDGRPAFTLYRVANGGYQMRGSKKRIKNAFAYYKNKLRDSYNEDLVLKKTKIAKEKKQSGD